MFYGIPVGKGPSCVVAHPEGLMKVALCIQALAMTVKAVINA